MRHTAGFKNVYVGPTCAKYQEGVDIWPLACLMVFTATGGGLPFGHEGNGVAVLRRLFQRMGVPPALLVTKNRWRLLQSEEGVEIAAGYRGGLSPDAGGGFSSLPPEQAWVKRVFQWAEDSRPSASDFVHESEAQN